MPSLGNDQFQNVYLIWDKTWGATFSGGDDITCDKCTKGYFPVDGGECKLCECVKEHANATTDAFNCNAEAYKKGSPCKCNDGYRGKDCGEQIPGMASNGPWGPASWDPQYYITSKKKLIVNQDGTDLAAKMDTYLSKAFFIEDLFWRRTKCGLRTSNTSVWFIRGEPPRMANEG